MTPARGQIALWTFSAVAVLAAHAGIVVAISTWSDPLSTGGATAVLVEMAPLAAESAAEHANLPIAPLQEQQTEPESMPEAQEQPDEVQPQPVPEQKLAEAEPVTEPPPPLPPTPPVTAEITLPPEVVKEERRPPPKKKMVVATAPERADRIAPRQRAAQAGAGQSSANVLQSYAINILRPHLMRHHTSGHLKESGVAWVTFSITKQGRLVSRRVSKSSGRSDIDAEALSTVQRAQPFPPPPPDLTPQQLVFDIPIRYNIR
jgi:periplasmic protein TonB